MTAASPGPSTSAGWAATPEAPPGPAQGLRYAGFWVRLVAFILDGIVLWVISAALSPLFGGSMVSLEGGTYSVNTTGSTVSAVANLVYFVGFWAWRGQSPGMIPFNMRIVLADDGGKVDVVRVLLRYVGLIISIVALLLGVIWIAFDRRKQGWHDKIAGTVVVRPA